MSECNICVKDNAFFSFHIHVKVSEEWFFDLLADNGDIFQNAVGELRELEVEVADLESFTSADFLTLDSISCDESSELIRSQIEILVRRHRNDLITLKDTYIKNPPEDKIRNMVHCFDLFVNILLNRKENRI